MDITRILFWCLLSNCLRTDIPNEFNFNLELKLIKKFLINANQLLWDWTVVVFIKDYFTGIRFYSINYIN